MAISFRDQVDGVSRDVEVSPTTPLPISGSFSAVPTASELRLGAFELQDSDAATRARIAVLTAILTSDPGLAVADPILATLIGALADAAVSGDTAGSLLAKLRGINKILGSTTDAAVKTDANGTQQQYLRGLVTLLGTDGIIAGGNSDDMDSGLVVSLTAYAALDSVGGTTSIDNVFKKNSGSGILQSISLTDFDNQKPSLDIFFFHTLPTGIAADNAAFGNMSQADLDRVIRRVSVAASDWVTIAGRAFFSTTISRPIVNKEGNKKLHMAIITNSTPTFTTVGSLRAKLGLLRD